MNQCLADSVSKFRNAQNISPEVRLFVHQLALIHIQH